MSSLPDAMALALTLQCAVDPKGAIIMCTEACVHNKLWADTLPDALELAYSLAAAGYDCDCEACKESPTDSLHIYRVDFSHPDREIANKHIPGTFLPMEAHGYAVVWQDTVGDRAYKLLGQKRTATVHVDEQGETKAEFL